MEIPCPVEKTRHCLQKWVSEQLILTLSGPYSKLYDNYSKVLFRQNRITFQYETGNKKITRLKKTLV